MSKRLPKFGRLPQKKPFQKFLHIEAFADGSYRPADNTAGAGVFFSALRKTNISYSASARVPEYKNHPYDALRAELYAALLALHSSRELFGTHHSLLIKQDSQMAIAC